MKRNPKCCKCSSTQTQKRGSRRGKLRFQCQSCKAWFQVNRSAKKLSSKQMLLEHLSGIPFRGLADIHGCGVATAHRKVSAELSALPTCVDVTRLYCQKFQGILLVDGKYLKVKSYERKIPVIYGVDYKTHDIPHYRLAKAENYLNCKRFFESIKLTNYHLQAVVCDDNRNIYNAAQYVFPNVVIQLCHLHFLRNVKCLLNLEDNKYHKVFWLALNRLMFTKRSKLDFDKIAAKLLKHFSHDETCRNILIELARKQPLLQGHTKLKGVPTTTNLIESLNSHLEARVKPLKGFESYKHASTWLNGYFLRRRTKPFTDCRGKFKRLNGKSSLQVTKKPNIELPSFF